MDHERPTNSVDYHQVLAPAQQSLPLVFASPHSGRRYPKAFVAASKLDRLNLRRSEDSFVDQIFENAPRHGAPLLLAHFPRAYVDVNREPFELDPAMFDEPLPSYVNTRSPRVAAGLGTIAKVVANGANIYGGRLSLDEVMERIRRCYWPYHAALRGLLEYTKRSFGHCILIDCHSMPSMGGPMVSGGSCKGVDIVLGDCHGTSCAAEVMETAERALKGLGYRVVRNVPYSGGFVTRHYGRPRNGIHALQIEINRALYMDESLIEPSSRIAELRDHMGQLIVALADMRLGPRPMERAAE